MNKAILGAVSLAVMGVCGQAAAQSRDVIGYLIDTRGVIVRDAYDLCWRTGYWTPALAVAECDPDLVPKPAPAPRPVARAVPPAEPKPAPKPAPVVAPPPPPPVVVPRPAPVAAPAPKPCDARFPLESDQLFAFGKWDLTDAAKARIERDVVGHLKSCASLGSIVVEGHTDRIGGEKYNLRLSERRAQAVKAFMVSKGLPESSIRTVGKGKSEPEKTCTGRMSRKDLIACLAPNRRVEVLVKGPGK